MQRLSNRPPANRPPINDGLPLEYRVQATNKAGSGPVCDGRGLRRSAAIERPEPPYIGQEARRKTMRQAFTR
ncbi:hypothetical protein ACCAA_50070 [Candidatus Accumulibacter aalborgensis]|uniref:Uncharacterized protein n=1 Tax=Candidatus Accumulibacter aalborgensis TaxID=1860102 RepID=A0A1A8XSX1_9PROT|nr:hypothetical protein ACCAA_50070 [Candidatus Accumulibacter aalborgensis]